MTKILGNGHWQCRNCQSRNLYNSEETTGAVAMTYNTPGPVDPTIVRTLTSNVLRCLDCNEKAVWIIAQEAVDEMNRRENVMGIWLGFTLSLVFAAIPFTLYDSPTEGLLFFGFSAVFLITGVWSVVKSVKSK
jgi:hypothetical protein